MYTIFALFKHLWEGLGLPFASTVRCVRYGLLGRWWPVRDHADTGTKKTLTPASPNSDVAVIIPCHNYGRFLAEAIESVLKQSVQPTTILVVDDHSTDDTQSVIQLFEDRGVRGIRVHCNSLAHTRNIGAQETRSTFLLYLDADDILPADYIERCLEVMDSPEIAIAYSDRQQFGESSLYIHAPDFSAAALRRQNFISSNALIRRQAFDLVGGFRQIEGSLEDWDFFRRVIAMGFTARKATTYLHQRMHKESMGYALKKNPAYSYARIAALAAHPVTIFTPFAGRIDVLDRYLDALKNLACDPTMIRLHWHNTSPDPAFDRRLRQEIAHLPFTRFLYEHQPLPSLWGHSPDSLIRNRTEDRENADYYYQLAVVRAYTVMLSQCSTEYVLTLEDDIAIGPQTLHLLQNAMQADTAAVIAPYKSGFYPRYEVWKKDLTGNNSTFKEKGVGIQEVNGAGFGCTLFRTDALRAIAPLHTGVLDNPPRWYDQISYARLQSYGRILCSWESEVEHMQTERYTKNLPTHFL